MLARRGLRDKMADDDLVARHQFPPAIIRHAVWLYVLFTLSYRDVKQWSRKPGLRLILGLYPRISARELASNLSEALRQPRLVNRLAQRHQARQRRRSAVNASFVRSCRASNQSITP
jgi:hypothetical protein